MIKLGDVLVIPENAQHGICHQGRPTAFLLKETLDGAVSFKTKEDDQEPAHILYIPSDYQPGDHLLVDVWIGRTVATRKATLEEIIAAAIVEEERKSQVESAAA